MDLKQLKALQAIAETGSFNDAAEQVGLTQSALSHQIRNLEEEFEETLLIRARPRAYPTAAGLAVISAAKKIQAELDQLHERFARAQRGPVTGTLRIAATNLAVVYVLGDLCESFLAKYPGIELIFRATETPEEAIRRVVAGAADVAFSPFPAADNDQLVRVMLGMTEHAFIVSDSHPLAAQTTVSLNDLRPYPFVRFAPGSGTRGLTDALFLSNGGYPPIQTESNDAEFVKRVVAMQGCSTLSRAKQSQQGLL
jgi:DNA-binding transcriptional LysR family regulator